MSHGDPQPASLDRKTSRFEEDLLHAIRSIRFGSVEVIIHDSRVVQIERKEKLRFDSRPEPAVR
jgi:hypothetical protein